VHVELRGAVLLGGELGLVDDLVDLLLGELLLVKAMPRNMVVRTMPAASGWRAMAVLALPTTMPMPMPGPMAGPP
jgi:hypothetical protein